MARVTLSEEMRRRLKRYPYRGPKFEAFRMILVERQRQLESEGWPESHDDHHIGEELFKAGNCYLLSGSLAIQGKGQPTPPVGWPWGVVEWKPKDAKRDLVRAGALFVAESDRLLRRHLGSCHTHLTARLAETINLLAQL